MKQIELYQPNVSRHYRKLHTIYIQNGELHTRYVEIIYCYNRYFGVVFVYFSWFFPKVKKNQLQPKKCKSTKLPCEANLEEFIPLKLLCHIPLFFIEL